MMKVSRQSFSLWTSTGWVLMTITTLCSCQSTTTTDFISGRILTTDEQQDALDLILNKTIGSAFETYGMTSLDNETAVIGMRNTTTTPSKHYEFMFGVNEMLLQLFQDAHYRVEVTNFDSYQYLDLCLQWLSSVDDGETPSGLISNCDTPYAKLGDAIVSIGGLTPNDLFEKLKGSIPHENNYFLMALPEDWLVREDFLSYFQMLDDDDEDNDGTTVVPVILERDGMELDVVHIPLGTNSTSVDDDETSFVSYEILEDSKTGIFTLNNCIYNEEYVSTMNEFWNVVLNDPETIDTVILDLRKNRGGDFTVAPAFLSYITSDYYDIFAVDQRQSEDYCIQIPTLCAPETLAILASLGVNVTEEIYTIPNDVMFQFFVPAMENPDTLFTGEFYVLTSEVTFSSAHLFAGVVQNNGMGELVGTPTGNTPSFWGNLIRFDVPNTDLRLFVTTSKSIMAGDGDAVHPDDLVITTREDIIEGNDPQLESIVGKTTTASPTTSSPTLSPTSSVTSSTESPTMEPTESDDSSSSPTRMVVGTWIGLALYATFWWIGL